MTNSTLSPATQLNPEAFNDRNAFQSVLACQLRAAGSPKAATPAADEPVDMNRLLEMVNDEPQRLRELASSYLVEADDIMEGLWTSVQKADWDQTMRLAHRLSGTSAVCGMRPLAASLRELEIKAKDGRWSENQALLQEAGRQHIRVANCLRSYGLRKLATAAAA
jgi:HPt (histidine-containing phosphotransfer) domain-containing protein